jgi:hypothetical protein
LEKYFLYAGALYLVVTGTWVTWASRRGRGQGPFRFASRIGRAEMLLNSPEAGVIITALGVILALAVYYKG